METIPKPSEPALYPRDCPARAILDRVGDKWAMLIVDILAQSGMRRFNELRRIVEGISQKMLTQTLRDLERDGLVQRTVYAEIPPRVEYRLTDLGRTLCEPLQALASWAHDHIDDVKRAQARFDAR
jgi:DNA-binding HxlR family transcriptional regulator